MWSNVRLNGVAWDSFSNNLFAVVITTLSIIFEHWNTLGFHREAIQSYGNGTMVVHFRMQSIKKVEYVEWQMLT